MSKRKRWRKKFPLLESMLIKKSTCLDRNRFRADNIKIIGQANSQLIFCRLTDQRLLLAFDQHAVHERIRFERLIEESFDWKNNRLKAKQIAPPYEMKISVELYEKIENITKELERNFALKIAIKTQKKITIKDCDGKILISINPARDRSLKLTPFLIEQMRMQACKGSIQFNEKLTHKDCDELIKALSGCKACFRCAHGRILVKPILYIPEGDKINPFRKIIEEKIDSLRMENFLVLKKKKHKHSFQK
ncbi:DNA mismatch repair protein mlh3-like protein [Sarcoptes scabiei]|uniref:DNA mismatch repair protein mlh3-like protein n=1 Tax=Sarcoptes scabiei TaxID=52283 RepID=A0A132AC93_SARSC|nr:DNA mismatch repair protein mlh3-like protein [Sarcoptes scabiei]